MHNILDSQLEQLLSGSKESCQSIPVHFSIHHSMPNNPLLRARADEHLSGNRIQRELTTVSLS